MNVHRSTTIAKKWKQFKCPSTGVWVNKLWDFHRVEYYSVRQRKKVLIHATKWMNLKSKRPHVICFHLYEISRIGKSIETESRLVVARLDVGGMGHDFLTGPGFSFGKTKTI